MIEKKKTSENHRFAIKNDNGDVISRAYVKVTSKDVKVFRVRTNKEYRNQGYASEILRAIVNEYHYTTISMKASAIKEEDGLDTEALLRFYERFGFLPKTKGSHTLVRQPDVFAKPKILGKLSMPDE